MTDSAESFIRLTRRGSLAGVNVVGILDESPRRHARSVQGVKVRGALRRPGSGRQQAGAKRHQGRRARRYRDVAEPAAPWPYRRKGDEPWPQGLQDPRPDRNRAIDQPFDSGAEGDRARRSARPAGGGCRRPGHRRADQRTHGAGDRRRRFDRLGALPADRAVVAAPADHHRQLGVPSLFAGHGTARKVRIAAHRNPHRRRARWRAGQPGLPEVQARHHLPRRGAEACSAGRGEPAGGDQDQPVRHEQRRQRRARRRRLGLRDDLDRQGGQSDQHHGRDQARGGSLLPGARRFLGQDPLQDRPLRQRARLERLGRPAFPGADRQSADR